MPNESSIYEPLAIIMVIIMLFLLIVIALLANVLLGAVTWHSQKEKVEENAGAGNKAVTAVAIIGLLLSTFQGHAQDVKENIAVAKSFGGLSPSAFYFMSGVLAVEVIVIFVLLLQLKLLIAKKKLQLGVASKPSASSLKTIWQKLNKFKPVEQEREMDLGHDYDGIRELDNRLPPWWLYGFYVTIIFGVIYLWRYHVSETAPLSGEEYAIAMREAEQQKAAFMKKAANNVDENTVKLLTDAQAIAGGQKVFDQNCSPCHGKAGEGTVGPNLTDDYWLHGGSVNDIFKSIKYGWPEKGMRSWKDDLSPGQIAQIASYIKTLHGTNPPNAKEKQGELYTEVAVSEKVK